MECIAVMATLALVQALSAVAADETIARYDLTPTLAADLSDPTRRRAVWDEVHLVAALQGLANRHAPRLYLRYNAEADDFWWARMTEPGGWLEGRQARAVEGLDALLERFADCYSGAVVWDERVPATSNLASTIAGCDSLLPIRFDETADSLYQRLVGAGRLQPVVRLLADDSGPLFTGQGTVPGTAVASSGSAKCDAYLWLMEHYVKAGKTDPHRMGYYLDGYWLTCWASGGPATHTLTNHDYVIAHRGVLFDLNVWDDETPIDDRGQPPGTDAATLRALLRCLYDQFNGKGTIQVAGFVPWAYKYTRFGSAGGTHAEVPTEWRYAEILSCFNAYMDADALGLSAMANASFYQHYPLPERLPQRPKPTAESLRARGLLDADGRITPRWYVAHYVGDYDSAAWLYQCLPGMWADPARGKVPLSWAFNPNLAERFPLGMAWARQHATEADWFVAGDSGAGYLNPGYLSEPRPHSGLPSGMAAWEEHCARFYRQWDLSVTGFVIDGFARGLTTEGLDAYARFSPDGIVAQQIGAAGVHNGMPYLKMAGDLPGDPADAARQIVSRFHGPGPQFAVFRSILQPPSWYLRVTERLDEVAQGNVVTVDLYTLLGLVRERESHPELYETPSAYSSATAVAAAPGQELGLWPLWWDDGPFVVGDVDGVTCWRLPTHVPPYYLYFDVDDGFADSLRGTATIEVEYLDRGAGRFDLQYDSAESGAYCGSGAPVARQGTGAWRTAVFALDDVRFAGAQNAGADFRLFSAGDDLVVRRVRVAR